MRRIYRYIINKKTWKILTSKYLLLLLLGPISYAVYPSVVTAFILATFAAAVSLPFIAATTLIPALYIPVKIFFKDDENMEHPTGGVDHVGFMGLFIVSAPIALACIAISIALSYKIGSYLFEILAP